MHMNSSGWRAFPRRVVGAALLRSAVYEEVEADRTASIQALVVVLIASLAAGIGIVTPARRDVAEVITHTVAALALWVSWSMVTLEIGVHLLPDVQTRADVGQLLRTTGFAAAPGLLRIAGVIPGVSRPVFVISVVWMLAAMVVAVRQALDYSRTTRAIAVCVLGWLFAAGFALLLGFWFARRVF
jgi:hypothetical protein